MGLTLTSVHETAKDPNTGMDRIVAENPYLRVKQGDYPPIYIQRGQVYDESGNIIKPIPDWAHDEIAKASPEALAKAGWKIGWLEDKFRNNAQNPKAEAALTSKSQIKRIDAQKAKPKKTKAPKQEPEPEDVGLGDEQE